MNDLLLTLGIESWKPALSTLLLPPLPLLLLILVGALMLRRRALGWLPLLAGLGGLWALSTPAAGQWLTIQLTDPPAPLSARQLQALRDAPHTAIVVLGAGRQPHAPEYDGPVLKPLAAERLRYGLWLARRTGLPLAFSGGLGHGAEPGPSEADAAALAAREAGQPLRWAEGRSRDTGENARYTLEMLRPAGIERIVLVTQGFHMRRALGAFERAAAREGRVIELVPAPTGARPSGKLRPGDFVPGPEGLRQSWLALHEWLGRLAGA
ncbi:YdcF family protein [Rubrivivax gelatinosus]|uniref:Uncharacterized SAM-binding protein YcdF (DUF218 family) n=1 Tax=Rubrivivax gelatinosus TaxID=28068 RepID=A0A4R2MC08_RUBGE|nr:YdcF family protein [Rubrivivax gelatinosus]MBK1689762.1 hypothetical protein [Rubrivivax gelatinosus]TCP04262.1 uncharacterized SAM-binding protein YcdF (DUF218 family) [Rubrivivax gelatinosus]